MNILIVGASGAVGVAVQKELANHGHRLHCVDLRPPPYDMRALLELYGYDAAIPEADRVYADVLREGVAEEVVRDMDACVYCALSPGPWKNSALQQMPLHVIGPSELVREGLKAGLRRFVYASSVSVNMSVMNPVDRTLTEGDPPIADSAYALSKWLAERMLERYAQAFDLRCACLRLGTIRPHWVQWGPANRGRAYRWRQYMVDVRDAARAFRLALEHATLGFEVLNIVSHGAPMRASPARAKAVLGFEAQYNGPDHFRALHRGQEEFLARHGTAT